MNVLQSIRDVGYGYYNEIPKDTLQTVAKSAFYSFTVSLLGVPKPGVAVNLSRPLESSGIAALAALIYSLTTPVFNYAFGDNQIVCYREVIKDFVTKALTAFAYSYLTVSKVNLIAEAQFFQLISFNVLKASFDVGPTIVNWMNPAFAQDTRRLYTWLGIQVEPGSGSIFLMN